MTPEAELLDIIEDYQKKIDRLTIWRTGPDRLQSLLRIAVRPRAEMAQHNLDARDFPWESLVEIMIEWHYKYPIGSAQCSEEDAFEALALAVSFMRLDPLRAAVRVGGYRVRRNSGAFKVTYKWDMGAEVADMMLEQQARKTGYQETTQAELDWAKTQTRNRLNSFSPPINLLRSASVRANLLVDQIKNRNPEGYLPDDFSLGAGLTVRMMTKVITGLMAIADLGELAHRRVAHPGTTLLHAQRSMYIGWIRQLHSDLSEEIVGAAIDRLMVGPKRSLRTSLLVPNEDTSAITMLPLLMFPRVLDATMLRTAATDPNQYGPIGQRQGARAKALTEWIGRIPGVKAIERVKLKSPSGRVLGDLDVVAIDPNLRRGIIFEVKWPIDAVTLNEALKTEEWIAAAASQLAGCRRLLNAPDSDVQFTFPSGWPEFRDVEWEWCVCTPQQLSPRPLSEPDMTATSFRYLTSLAATSSLDDIVKILRKPDYPKLGKHYAVERIRLELDRHVINMDALGVLDIDWLPSCH